LGLSIRLKTLKFSIQYAGFGFPRGSAPVPGNASFAASLADVGEDARRARARLHALQLLAAVDFYLLGWADVVLSLFTSSFSNTASKRSFMSDDLGVRIAPLAQGFEQWFVAGRELAARDADVNPATLRLLAGTSVRVCPRAALPTDE
jgi:hypothetical protein